MTTYPLDDYEEESGASDADWEYFTCDDCGEVTEYWCGRCYCCQDCCICADPVWTGGGDIDESESASCGCRFCYCSNPTIAGEVCNECLAGAHRG